jgi:hypothetical protein
MMGNKGNLVLDGTVVEALPWGTEPRYRRTLKVSAEVPRGVAMAHLEMVDGEPCSIVRESPRGPRGGRGKLHYNAEAESSRTHVRGWPTAWLHRKGERFYIVQEVVQHSHQERTGDLKKQAELAKAYGASPAMARQIAARSKP